MIQSSELENDIVTVSKLQVALRSEARSLQSELSELTLEADTETTEGLKNLLEDAALVLLRNSEHWTHVLGNSQTINEREKAENVFNRFSIEERSKFSAETLTNVDGKIRQKPVKIDPNEGSGAYIVVTLLIGTADDKPLFSQIASAEAMQEALKQVSSIATDYLMVFELLWSPQVEADTLTEAELATEYSDLVAIA
ncbi:MAG: DUF1517 domain-containing protein [Kastovskya adunca ATA6-11-RM4]|jgi:uncharacterized membrane protein|nr:DUF1517 domain-containing protein [Kastovskya adunca ATA6-11-RM4]